MVSEPGIELDKNIFSIPSCTDFFTDTFVEGEFGL